MVGTPYNGTAIGPLKNKSQLIKALQQVAGQEMAQQAVLEVRVHPDWQVLCYASETRILDIALHGAAGWQPLPLAHGEGLVVNTQAWTLRRVPFLFQGLYTEAGHSYTGATIRKEKSR